MKLSLKCAIWVALLMAAVGYWALAIFSTWIICEDSKAVQDFWSAQPLVSEVTVTFWLADMIGGRYIVTILLVAIGWWVFKLKIPAPQNPPPAKPMSSG